MSEAENDFTDDVIQKHSTSDWTYALTAELASYALENDKLIARFDGAIEVGSTLEQVTVTEKKTRHQPRRLVNLRLLLSRFS